MGTCKPASAHSCGTRRSAPELQPRVSSRAGLPDVATVGIVLLHRPTLCCSAEHAQPKADKQAATSPYHTEVLLELQPTQCNADLRIPLSTSYTHILMHLCFIVIATRANIQPQSQKGENPQRAAGSALWRHQQPLQSQHHNTKSRATQERTIVPLAIHEHSYSAFDHQPPFERFARNLRQRHQVHTRRKKVQMDHLSH